MNGKAFTNISTREKREICTLSSNTNFLCLLEWQKGNDDV